MKRDKSDNPLRLEKAMKSRKVFILKTDGLRTDWWTIPETFRLYFATPPDGSKDMRN